MELKLKWTGKITLVQGDSIFLENEQKLFGKIVFRIPVRHEFKTGEVVSIDLEKTGEPPPLSSIGKKRVILYGVVYDYVMNGIVIIKWGKPSWYYPKFYRDELVAIIDESFLNESPFYRGDCVRFK